MPNSNLRLTLMVTIVLTTACGLGPNCAGAGNILETGITSDQEETRQRAFNEAIAARKMLIDSLIGVLGSDTLRMTNPDSVRLSMLLLGSVRAVEAVPALVGIVAWPSVNYKTGAGRAEAAEAVEEREFVNGGGRNMPHTWGHFDLHSMPAVEALVSVGHPCIPAVLDKLRLSDNRPEIEACLRVVVELDGRTGCGVLLAQEALDEKDGARQRRLTMALQYLSYFPATAHEHEESTK